MERKGNEDNNETLLIYCRTTVLKISRISVAFTFSLVEKNLLCMAGNFTLETYTALDSSSYGFNFTHWKFDGCNYKSKIFDKFH